MKKFTLIMLALVACFTAKAADYTITPDSIIVSDNHYVQLVFSNTHNWYIRQISQLNRVITFNDQDSTVDILNNQNAFTKVADNAGLFNSTVTIHDAFYLPAATADNVKVLLSELNLRYTFAFTRLLNIINESGTYNISFDSSSSRVVTAVDDVNATKSVAGIKYYNLNGQQSAEPFSGVNVMVTTYTDGTTSTQKVMK